MRLPDAEGSSLAGLWGTVLQTGESVERPWGRSMPGLACRVTARSSVWPEPE